MKGTVSILIVLCSLMLCAAGFAEAPVMFKPGTYEASADGFFSELTVTLTVDRSAITSITIVGDETPAIGGAAMASMQAAYVGKSDASDVDMVSGATFTSKAIREAVANALDKAKTVIDSAEDLHEVSQCPTLRLSLSFDASEQENLDTINNLLGSMKLSSLTLEEINASILPVPEARTSTMEPVRFTYQLMFDDVTFTCAIDSLGDGHVFQIDARVFLRIEGFAKETLVEMWQRENPDVQLVDAQMIENVNPFFDVYVIVYKK